MKTTPVLILFLALFSVSAAALPNQLVMYDTFTTDGSSDATPETDGKLWINDSQNNFTILNVDSEVDAFCYDAYSDGNVENCTYRTAQAFNDCQSYSESLENPYDNFFTVCNNTQSKCTLSPNLDDIFEVDTSQIIESVYEVTYWKNCDGSGTRSVGSPSFDYNVYDMRRAECNDVTDYAVYGRTGIGEWDPYSPDFFCSSNQQCDMSIDDENETTSRTASFNPCRLKTGEACTVDNECLTGVSCVQGFCGNNLDVSIINVTTIQIIPSTTLVINKTAYARVTVQSIGNRATTVSIGGKFNNVSLVPITSSSVIMQNGTNQTFDFVFTPQTNGILMFNVSVAGDVDQTNNQHNTSITIFSPPILELHYEQAKLYETNQTADITQIKNQHEQSISSFFPLGDMGVKVTEATDNVLLIENTPINQLMNLLNIMTMRQLLNPVNSSKKNIVMVPNGFFNDLGLPAITSAVQRRNDSPFQDIFVHEEQATGAEHQIGHTLTICDENSTAFAEQDRNLDSSQGGCPNHDNDEDGQLDSTCGQNGCLLSAADSRLVAELVKQETYISPYYNFMGQNNTHIWIDQESYDAIVTNNKEPDYTNSPVIVASAMLYSNGTLVPQTFYATQGGILTSENDFKNGNYSLIVRNTTGIIYNFTFEPDFEMLTNNNSNVEFNETYVYFTIPYQNVESLTFQANDTIISQITVSASTPSLSINSVNRVVDKNFIISWNASDADNDTIHYAILISPDGGATYSTYLIDYSNDSIILNSDDFTYSENYRIRILATDGVNTVEQETNLFTMGSPLRINSFERIHTDLTKTVYVATFENRGQATLTDINYTFNQGDGINYIQAGITLLAGQSYSIVYELPNNTTINSTALFNITNGTVTDQKEIFLENFETSLGLVSDMGAIKIFEANITNLGNAFIGNINWTLDIGEGQITQTIPVNLTALQKASILLQINFTNFTARTLNFTAYNSVHNSSDSISIFFNELKLDLASLNLNGTILDFEFNTSSIWHQNVTYNWTVDINSTKIDGNTPVTLISGNDISTIFAYNFTTTGLHSITVIETTNITQYNKTINVTI